MRSVLLVALVGCGYRGGTFRDPSGSFGGHDRTVGCLDVGVSVGADAAAEGPVLAYGFGNRCDRAAVVDLGAVVVTGRTADGDEVALAPYDPAGELRPARIDARRTGREAIEYAGARDVRMICADLGGLDGGDGPSQVVCLDVGVAVAVAGVP